MTTFTLIILILFVGALAFQFVSAIEKDCLGLAFAYLTNALM